MEDRVYAAVGGALRAINHASVAATPGVDPALRRNTPIGEQLQLLRQDMENHLYLLDRKEYPGAEIHNLEVFACDVEYKIEQFVRAVSSNPLLVIVKDCGCFSLAGLTRVTAGFEFPRHHLPDLLNNSRQITDNVKARARQGFPVPVPTYPEESAEIWRSRKDFLYADGSHVVGGIFKQQVKKLVDDVLALLNDDSKRVSLIPIVGMAGIGKTTLAKMVYKSVERHFDCSAMLCISQIPDEYQLTRDLAEQVGLFVDDEPSRDLRRYLGTKRYLILLDDVWDTPSWRNLANAIPRDCKSGSIIISTSRNKQVYTSEGGELLGTLSCHLAPLYELQPLDETDSWNLFLSKMGAVDPELIQSLREKMVRKCCGVPLAIVSVADSLCKTTKSWQDELDKVVEGDGGICSEALELSYQYLPVGLRVCFLYLGLFQDNYELFATDIINQWIAQGFVAEELPFKEQEDTGESYLNGLVANSMVEVSSRRFNGRIRSFRVLGIVHSFCEWKGGHALRNTLRNTATAHPPSLPLMVERGTFLDGTRPFPADLHTVVVCSNYQKFYSKPAVEMLLKGCDFIQVLTPGSRELPFCLTKELRNLKLLAYLGCSDHSLLPAKVKLPSAIGHLNGLLTLDLRNVEYETIPERIWTMEQLRHILLGKLSLRALSRIDTNKDGTKEEKKKIKVNLPNLMTLYVVPGQLLPDEVLEKSKKLRKLGIDHPKDKTLRLLSSPFRRELEILRLRFHPGRGRNGWFVFYHHSKIRRLNLITTEVPRQRDLPFYMVKLVLEISHMKEDPMEALKGLSRLEILKLYVDRCSLDNMVCSGGPRAFPKLEKLELHLPFYIRKFTVEEHAMPKLMKVTGISSRMLLDVPKRIRAVCVFTK